MPSSDIVDNEIAATKPKKRGATPRRSPAVRRPANSTPIRKLAANKRGTPNSVPPHTKSGIKKAEPTLLGDFLLGRPSVNRPRRKSLDVAPMEMKKAAVGKVQPPEGVKERVKQWRKGNAAMVMQDAVEPPSEPDDVFSEWDDKSVTERDRCRIKFRKNLTQRPGRRKSGSKDDSSSPIKSVSSPKKRVVSDDHWMMNKEKKVLPQTPGIINERFSKGVGLSKEFLERSTDPPLERKIQEWKKRIAIDEGDYTCKQARKVSKNVSTEEETETLPSGSKSADHEIRIKSSVEKSNDKSMIAKPLYSERRRKGREQELKNYNTPRRRTGEHKEPLADIQRYSKSSTSSTSSLVHEKSPTSPRTPTNRSRTRNSQRESVSPESLADIPVGYSAFSVLDIQVGDEANTARPLKPVRQPSLSVPRVLKKVYTEGMKIMQDAVDPPRIGVSQPPSIESWLKGTSDPFVDAPVPKNVSGIAKPKSRRRSYDKTPSHLAQEAHQNKSEGVSIAERPDLSVSTTQYSSDIAFNTQAGELSANRKALNKGKTIEKATQSLSPTSLKRSPATRNSSPLRSIKHNSFRDNLTSSYSGEPKSRINRGSPDSSANVPELDNELQVNSDSVLWGLKDQHIGVDGSTQRHCSPKSPRIVDASRLDSREPSELHSYKVSRPRDRPTTGQHRLSTIASVETFTTSSSLTSSSLTSSSLTSSSLTSSSLTSSSLTETSSELSQTTVTQTTFTQNTSTTSNTSNTSYKSDEGSDQNKHIGLKGRITKHSDLLSVLSLPDTPVPGRTISIRSARSIRTTRTTLATATVPDLLRELADDEVKYMRELKTLVDGVIPVLLTCVISKSNCAVAAGLFSPTSSGQADDFITTPIVDMGIALEQLKIFHKRIPLTDPDTLIRWSLGVHKVYKDYIAAWRMGFQNVIVNLAPASQHESAEGQYLDEIPRNMDGDVLNDNGDRVDVAFLLKRPLVRIKYLAKVVKGIYNINPGEQAAQANDQFQDLVTTVRKRTKEEEARLEDRAACNTDVTRARHPRTLALTEVAAIDPTRQVSMKDFFDFSLPHSSGQRIDCRVEMILRDKPHDKSDVGDVLICEVDSLSHWLLFPPIELDHVSARPGDAKGELVVMVRGTEGSISWRELFILKSVDEETAAEWIQELGLSPVPGLVQHVKAPPATVLSIESPINLTEGLNKGSSSPKTFSTLSSGDVDVPIGERLRKEEKPSLSNPQNGQERNPAPHSSPRLNHSGRARAKESTLYRTEPRNLNEAMERAGKLSGSDATHTRAKRYHSNHESKTLITPSLENSLRGNDVDLQHRSNYTHSPIHSFDLGRVDDFASTDIEKSPSKLLSTDLPFTQDRRISNPAINDQKGLILKGSEKAGNLENDAVSSPATKQIPKMDDEAPPPPPHRVSSPAASRKVPILVTTPSTVKTRLSSSPLKYEYQPGDSPGTSSESDEFDSGGFGVSSDSEELEAEDLVVPLPVMAPRKRVSPSSSFYSLPSASLAPSNSASQAPFHENSSRSDTKTTTKLVAAISCWSSKGRWVDLHHQDCSVVVTPGLIEAFVMGVYHSSVSAGGDDVISSGSSDSNTDNGAAVARPLVALELTPIVPLRQSNALDIEIRSPPTSRSSVECTHTVRFRSRNFQECSALYAAIHKARLENPVYKKLEQEQVINSYGKQPLQEVIGGNRRRSWLGRSKSYRASTRAPSVIVSEKSTNSFASAISRLRNMGGIGAFNIAKSSISTSQGGPVGTSSGTTSFYTDSADSGITPPRTPSTAMTGMSNVVSLGSTDLKIRLYIHVRGSTWRGLGYAFLTVTNPPRGMRQASSLYHGVEKRIMVTRNQLAKLSVEKDLEGPGTPISDYPKGLQVILDIVIGGGCFSRMGVRGIIMHVWEDIVGDNGEVGTVAAVGGVSGRTRKWMFQSASGARTSWIFALVGGGSQY